MLESPHCGVKVVYPALRDIGRSRHRFQRDSTEGGKNHLESEMFYVYILKSSITKKHYIGCTDDLERRLLEHNNGKVKSSKAYKPWAMIYTESYNTGNEAFKRERQIKSYKGSEAFRNLLLNKRRDARVVE
jgi:putative endonuclease